VVQGFFFDRVDTETAGATIADQFNLIVKPLAHIAQTPLAFLQPAVARTEVTLQLSITELVPVPGRNYGVIMNLH
jgi:hypothetical protein